MIAAFIPGITGGPPYEVVGLVDEEKDDDGAKEGGNDKVLWSNEMWSCYDELIKISNAGNFLNCKIENVAVSMNLIVVLFVLMVYTIEEEVEEEQSNIVTETVQEIPQQQLQQQQQQQQGQWTFDTPSLQDLEVELATAADMAGKGENGRFII